MTELAEKGVKKHSEYKWPSWPVWGDEEREALIAVLESGEWWYGERVREFEQEYASFQGARFGVSCSSGTSGLEAALSAIGVGSGDEAIVPPYTFVATASAVLRVGAVPVFADIEPDTLCIDPDDVARKITCRTKAIIPVHLAGRMADMDRLGEIARSHGLYLIEDACHAWGSQWKGKGAGTVGHCGVFSFQASKNISSAEGGIVVTDDEAICDAVRSYTNCGRQKGCAWYEHFTVATNARMTEFQAALLLAQLGRLEDQMSRRQASADILDRELRNVGGILTIKNDSRVTRRSYHFYPFRLTGNLRVRREHFLGALAAEGVSVSAGYPIPLYRNPLFTRVQTGPHARRLDYSSVCCPTCEMVCADTCWIPHNYLLADEENIRLLAESIRKVCENVEEMRGD